MDVVASEPLAQIVVVAIVVVFVAVVVVVVDIVVEHRHSSQKGSGIPWLGSAVVRIDET